jgi:PAS domain S-box-containing protein
MFIDAASASGHSDGQDVIGSGTPSLFGKAMEGILESSPDPVFILDRQGRFLAVGQAGSRAFGLSASEIIGKTAHEIGLDPKVAADLADRNTRVFQTKNPPAGNTPSPTVMGLRHYENHCTPLLNEQSEVIATLWIARDVTEGFTSSETNAPKRLQEARHAHETHFREMADAFPQLAWTAHPDGFIHWYNRRWYEYTGTTPQDMEGWGWQSVHDPEALPHVLKKWQASIATGEPFEMVFPLRGVDGRFRSFLTRVHPRKDAEGRVTQWFGNNIDVEELRRAEEALHERQAEIEILNNRLRRAMTETHHRVKNNLQLISALIELQSQGGQESVPMSEFVRLGQNIQALGVIHDILTKESRGEGEATMLSSKEVLEQFLPLLQSTLGGRQLRAQVADIALPGKQATSLTLIANELVSNAIKHGTGDVELKFSAAGNRAMLEVCDDGRGFAKGFDPETAAHTGLDLIENIARYDLRGETSYENRPEGGARIVVSFPVHSSSLQSGQDARRK